MSLEGDVTHWLRDLRAQPALFTPLGRVCVPIAVWLFLALEVVPRHLLWCAIYLVLALPLCLVLGFAGVFVRGHWKLLPDAALSVYEIPCHAVGVPVWDSRALKDIA